MCVTWDRPTGRGQRIVVWRCTEELKWRKNWFNCGRKTNSSATLNGRNLRSWLCSFTSSFLCSSTGCAGHFSIQGLPQTLDCSAQTALHINTANSRLLSMFVFVREHVMTSPLLTGFQRSVVTDQLFKICPVFVGLSSSLDLYCPSTVYFYFRTLQKW